MSSFNGPTRHPVTGKVEQALWIDDYYGRHRYAVRFNDGQIFNPEDYPDLRVIRPPYVAEPPPPPLPRTAIICAACGSTRVTESWKPGELECLDCGATGKT